MGKFSAACINFYFYVEKAIDVMVKMVKKGSLTY